MINDRINSLNSDYLYKGTVMFIVEPNNIIIIPVGSAGHRKSNFGRILKK